MSTTPSQTLHAVQDGSLFLNGTKPHLPQKLPFTLDEYPKLDAKQAGHLRHFHNLATQWDGDWSHMSSPDPAQEWSDAFRYQLATMSYAAGLAHYHRLPAVRAPFRTLMEELIQKMLRPEVWSYWYFASMGGKKLNPGLKDLAKPRMDPVAKDNIMYSGHLLLMVSLYAMLFDSDKYDAPGSLTFDFHPLFWGMGAEKFEYDRMSLQAVILRDFEEYGWLGCPCEPNVIFISCNQFPLVAIHYNDVRNGTKLFERVIQNYKAAWAKKNNMEANDQGVLVDAYMVKQDKLIGGEDYVSMSAWSCAMMNAWDRERVHALYDRQRLGYFSWVGNGEMVLNIDTLPEVIRSISSTTNSDPDSESVYHQALAHLEANPPPAKPADYPYHEPEFAYVAEWVSEMGDSTRLAGLLAHADAKFGPTWEKGGYYYPVRPLPHEYAVDPLTGNAALGYARLNVADGQHKMFEAPWEATRIRSYPAVEGVGLDSGVDFLRGIWDEEKAAFILRMRTWAGQDVPLSFTIANLPQGAYGLYVEGNLQKELKAVGGSEVEVSVVVNGKGVDVVLLGADAL